MYALERKPKAIFNATPLHSFVPNDEYIISTHLEFSKWEEFFPDPMLNSALIDRVTFNAQILIMNGESFRLNHSAT
jgi:DNA replication protein DnaC